MRSVFHARTHKISILLKCFWDTVKAQKLCLAWPGLEPKIIIERHCPMGQGGLQNREGDKYYNKNSWPCLFNAKTDAFSVLLNVLIYSCYHWIPCHQFTCCPSLAVELTLPLIPCHQSTYCLSLAVEPMLPLIPCHQSTHCPSLAVEPTLPLIPCPSTC